MKHAREDYNRIQDPAGKIPDDEPVLLLRASDRYAPATALDYANRIAADPLAPTASQRLAKRARDWAYEMRDYARAHGSKYPDMPIDA